MKPSTCHLAAGPLMLDLEGLSLTAEEAQLLTHPAVGGVILFSRNFQCLQQLAELTTAIKAIRPALLLAVDHEGGRVQRFREGFTRIPAMGVLGEHYRRSEDKAAARQLVSDCGWLLASELLALGLDISFAPVLDRDLGISEVIGDRAFSASAAEVVVLASALMSGMQQAGMATTAKHFPGHGSVAADSHVAMPVDARPYEEIATTDMQVFQQLLPAVDAIMPAHVIYEQCDPSPAGFSAFWLQKVLRERLAFEGVIFSDDLSMEAAGVAGNYAERARQALAAGCDMVLACNNRAGALQVVNWLDTQPSQIVDKVNKMKSRAGAMMLADLQQTRRWQQTRAVLQALQRV